MLSSVTDLLRYIDENQLTSEFGGTLDYCHSDWIVLRTVSYKSTLQLFIICLSFSVSF